MRHRMDSVYDLLNKLEPGSWPAVYWYNVYVELYKTWRREAA